MSGRPTSCVATRTPSCLHLGCGLDTRAFRINPPPTVLWFDLDQPGVIELRRKLYDETDAYRMIGSSVTDPGWLEPIPTGRPTLVVAEGLLMYLAEREVRELLGRLTDRFDSGELLFDTLSPSGPRLSKLFTDGIVKWGIRDARDIEGMGSRAPIRRASLRGGGLPSRFRSPRSAWILPADVCDADAQLRRGEPVRVLGLSELCFLTSMPSGDSTRTASSGSGRAARRC